MDNYVKYNENSNKHKNSFHNWSSFTVFKKSILKVIYVAEKYENLFKMNKPQ